MKKLFKLIFDWMVRRWWLFPVVGVVCSVVLILSIDHLSGDIWIYLLLSLLFAGATVSLIMQLVTFIAALCRKRWWTAVWTVLTGLVNLAAYIMFPMLLLGMLLQSMPDDFGWEHAIPEGMEYSVPLGYVDDSDGQRMDFAFSFGDFHPEEPIIDSADRQAWLQIWNEDQGGRYLYDFYCDSLPDGEVYLRCYEATENIELSDDVMHRNTRVSVQGHHAFGKVVDKRTFVIYEGDWEDYYAVRVEVWFKPDKGKARKLLQKVYRMEGWMR